MLYIIVHKVVVANKMKIKQTIRKNLSDVFAFAVLIVIGVIFLWSSHVCRIDFADDFWF